MKMIKLIQSIIIIFTLQLANSQNKTPLSEKLWSQVQDCHVMLEDLDEDGGIDFDEIIDDSNNGYLKISGSWPTCGCNCESIVGAYRTSSNNYVFIKKSTWPCSWQTQMSASDSLHKIFPINFEAEGFFQNKIEYNSPSASFYLDIEIPRKGTDTKVTIKTIPLGLNIKSEKNIEFGYTEQRSANWQQLYQIRKIANKINNNLTIKYLLDGSLDKISSADKDLIYSTIGNDDDKFKSIETLVQTFQELKQKHKLYTQIKYKMIILGWNREKGSFYIKEKIEQTNHESFIAFLKNKQYYSPIC